jgi:hypothetical protein
VVGAIVIYVIALLLLLLALLVGDGEAGEYLFDGALISAGGATGTLLSSVRTRKRS